MSEMEQKVLKTLSHQYKTQAAASTEIINLQSILNLPKGTEHFLTDIHGEYEQFNHVLKNGSGSVRRKIDEEFGNTISNKDKKSLATLIYYPESKLEIVEREEDNLEDWYKISLHRLVQVIKRVSSKYTRSKVRKALPKDFAYVIEELITEKEEIQDKEAYYNEIIHTIIRIGRAPQFIIALSHLIQRLVIDHLHIVGDIYDRGPGPHIIMDTLCEYHSVDVQWGNHDMVWMGAAAGSLACIANVVRMSARYGNLATLEDGYGINLLPLATFALETYENTNCDAFTIKFNTDYNTKDLGLDTKMHKAIAILQFKLEGQLIMRHPEFHMEDRMLLHRIDFEKKTICVDGKEYPMGGDDQPSGDVVTSLDENFDASTDIPAGWFQKQAAGDKAWYVRNFSENNYITMSGFKGTAPFDQWLLSPAIDMDKVSDKTLTFDTQVNGYGATTTTLKVYIVTDPANLATATELKATFATAPAAGADGKTKYSEWVKSGNVDLAKYKGKVYIAFRYQASKDANYATWCVDNVKLNAAK